MINKVILLGNLGADPELRVLDSGTKVARIPLATNENYRDKNGEWQTITDWHNVVAWRNLAEQAERSMKKGDTIFVEGKISTRKYTDKDGVEKYATDVVASYMRIVNKRSGESSGSNYSGFPSDEPQSSKTPGQMSEKVSSSNENQVKEDTSADEDDLPF